MLPGVMSFTSSSSFTSFQISDTKLGFELECAEFRFQDKRGVELQNPKGTVLYVFRIGSDGVTLTRAPELELSDTASDLVATAEIGDSVDIISRTEFIFGGDIGSPMTTRKDMSSFTGFRVMQWLVLWKNLVNPSAIRVQPGGNPSDKLAYYQLNPVRVFGENIPLGAELMLQMTVGFPLAAFPFILQQTSLMKIFFYNDPKLKVVIKDLFARFDTWLSSFPADKRWLRDFDPQYARYTAVGFLVIAQAFVSVAVNPPSNDNRLKLQVPLMPRTDFRTMLRIATMYMQPPLQTRFRQALNDLLKPFQGSASLATLTWSFVPAKKEPVGPTLVTVSNWIADLAGDPESNKPDLITQGDKNRNSQIGGLGIKVERILHSSSSNGGDGLNSFPTPIFEFRGLKSLKWGELTSQGEAMWRKTGSALEYDPHSKSNLQELENWVRTVHAQVLDLKSISGIL